MAAIGIFENVSQKVSLTVVKILGNEGEMQGNIGWRLGEG